MGAQLWFMTFQPFLSTVSSGFCKHRYRPARLHRLSYFLSKNLRTPFYASIWDASRCPKVLQLSKSQLKQLVVLVFGKPILSNTPMQCSSLYTSNRASLTQFLKTYSASTQPYLRPAMAMQHLSITAHLGPSLMNQESINATG